MIKWLATYHVLHLLEQRQVLLIIMITWGLRGTLPSTGRSAHALNGLAGCSHAQALLLHDVPQLQQLVVLEAGESLEVRGSEVTVKGSTRRN